jgi:hypothetical protein
MISKLLPSVIAVSLLSAAAFAGPKVSERAHCKLKNVAVGKIIYDGQCKVTEELTSYGALFSIKMGSAEPMKFAGPVNSSKWLHGAEDVHYTNEAHKAVFKWSDFKLVVKDDGMGGQTTSNHQSTPQSNSSSKAQMKTFCKGMIAEKAGTRPGNVTIDKVETEPGVKPASKVYGTAHGKGYICQFDTEGKFVDVYPY